MPAMKTPAFTRASPSRRYRRLIEQYQLMHTQGETRLGIPPELTFPGQSLPPQAPHIKRLIRATGARTLLDYGCGKGQQYWPLRIRDAEEGVEYPDIRSYWGVSDVRLYDPGYAPHTEVPSGSFDGVICTDVLEHCPEEDLPWILGELFAYAEKFVYANVACFAARKRLPSGGNAHCTVKPPRWWEELIRKTAARKPQVRYEFRFIEAKGGAARESVLESRSANHSSA
jgi:hypothetical protein